MTRLMIVVERPILMSPPMVRATLRDIDPKTQTRRVVKPQPISEDIDNIDLGTIRDMSTGKNIRCPYGQPGDRLWVRETWRVGAWDEEEGSIAVDYRADNYARREWLSVTADDEGEVFNRLWEQSCIDADDAGRKINSEGRYKWSVGESPCRWRPSIFMPRWASRLTLEVTGVRVERLQEISEADAIAEGIPAFKPSPSKIPRMHYASLWDSLNAKRGFGWDKNPWVWVVEFKRVTA